MWALVISPSKPFGGSFPNHLQARIIIQLKCQCLLSASVLADSLHRNTANLQNALSLFSFLFFSPECALSVQLSPLFSPVNFSCFSVPGLSAVYLLNSGSSLISAYIPAPYTAAWRLSLDSSWAVVEFTSFVFHLLEVTILCCLRYNVLKTVVLYILSTF